MSDFLSCMTFCCQNQLFLAETDVSTVRVSSKKGVKYYPKIGEYNKVGGSDIPL